MGTIAQQFGLDQTLGIQIAVFLAAYFLLTQFYFKPFLKIIEARHRATTKNKAEAEAATEKAREMLEQYQFAIREERKTAKKQLEDALSEAKKEEEKLLTAARAEARDIALGAAQELAKQEAGIRSSIAKDVEALSAQLASKVL